MEAMNIGQFIIFMIKNAGKILHFSMLAIFGEVCGNGEE